MKTTVVMHKERSDPGFPDPGFPVFSTMKTTVVMHKERSDPGFRDPGFRPRFSLSVRISELFQLFFWQSILLIHGGRTVVRVADKHDDRRNNWIKELDQRRGKNISAVAVANKNARIAWAVLTKKEPYKAVA